jgi:hypothetical protein
MMAMMCSKSVMPSPIGAARTPFRNIAVRGTRTSTHALGLGYRASRRIEAQRARQRRSRVRPSTCEPADGEHRGYRLRRADERADGTAADRYCSARARAASTALPALGLRRGASCWRDRPTEVLHGHLPRGGEPRLVRFL